MTPEEIIDEAKRLITKERAEAYGDYNSMFKNVATMWTAYFGFNVTGQDVPICMALVKMMRQKQGKDLDDNFIDIIGYAALAAGTKKNGVADLVAEKVARQKAHDAQDLNFSNEASSKPSDSE
jgi:hypothetical protein